MLSMYHMSQSDGQLIQDKRYSTTSAVWSDGCLLYAWSVGHKPFEGMGKAELYIVL